jgi:hypothetical protein
MQLMQAVHLFVWITVLSDNEYRLIVCLHFALAPGSLVVMMCFHTLLILFEYLLKEFLSAILNIVVFLASRLSDPDSLRYVKFLYSHYLDALTHLFGARRSGNFVQLRNILMRATLIDALHAKYVAMLDFSRSPVRPVNGIEYSPALMDVPEEKE